MLKRLLITGANGFIGNALCEYLKASCICFNAATRTGTPLPVIDTLAVGKIDLGTDWSQALDGCDTVIHLTARAHVLHEREADPLSEFRKVNVQGTLALAKQAASAGVKRFVFLSSIGVNGKHNTQPFSESDQPAPSGSYAISKWEAEQVLKLFVRETTMELVIIRPPLVYGPNVPGNFATLVFWSCRGIPLPFGAIHNQRSFVALDNLISFIVLCADREKTPQAANEVFLISDGEDVSTTGILQKVAKAYGKRLPLLPVPEKCLFALACLAGNQSKVAHLLCSLRVDSSKARDLLGWRPVITMDEQLKKMADATTFAQGSLRDGSVCA